MLDPAAVMTMTRFFYIGPILLAAVCAAAPASSAELGQRQSRTMIHPPNDPSDLSGALPHLAAPMVLEQTLAEPISGMGDDVRPRSARYDGAHPHDLTVSRLSVSTRSDLDGDGYYHVLELRLDIDADGTVEWVYLKLYLSYQGGPWNLVHRSGDFHLAWSLFSNEIALTTVLDSGYPRGYYDMRVDVFDADTGRWLLSLGPYDDGALSSLALEDRERDEIVDQGSLSYDVGVYGTGSMGIGPVLLLGLTGLMRRFVPKPKTT